MGVPSSGLGANNKHRLTANMNLLTVLTAILFLCIVVLLVYYFFHQKQKNRYSKSTTLVLKDAKKTIQASVSVDVPEEMVVHVTLKLVDKKGGKTTSVDGTLSHTTPKNKPKKSQVSIKSVKNAKTTNKFNFQNILNSFQKIDLIQKIKNSNTGLILLLASILVYVLVISIGIERFPIYFFTDEAIHMNFISDFIRDGYRNYNREFLPTFFIASGWVNGTSVYVQWLPYLLFGKSIAATRLVSAFITLISAISLGLLLKQVFKIKYYWAGILILLTTPAWFLHARTAFEYAEVASFYMIFLYFYSRYRDGHLQSLYFAILSGALAFYTHGLGQILMSITGTALFFADIKYHIHPDRRKTVLWALVFGIILLLPFARYYLAHPNESFEQVQRRNSYWFNVNWTTSQKILEFIKQYTYGLNPLYWYFHNSVDLDRHVMKGYGHGLLVTLPFALIGFTKVVRNLHHFSYRTLFIAFLAAPLPASVVAIGMPRMLWMSIPLALMTTIGLSLSLEKLDEYWIKISKYTPWILFTVLTSLSFFMLRDALVNGPLWFKDYGLFGMQYGAKQVFEETILPELKSNPNIMFSVSPSWANGTDEFADFFIPAELRPRVFFGQPIDWINNLSSINQNLHFILPYNEYNNLIQDPKFKAITVYKVINYPDGTPGFYVVSLTPADNITSILNAEKIKNITPVDEILQLAGQEVHVAHSPLGAGSLTDVFDNDPNTLVRVLEANPFIFDISPTTPIDTQSIIIQTGTQPNFTIKVSLYAPGENDPVTYTNTYKDLPPDPTVTINFDKGPQKSARIYIEIEDNTSGETSQIHVRTINIK